MATTTAVNIEEVSQVKRKISVEVPWDEVAKELEIVYKKINRKAKVRGFRPGHVPKPYLERFYAEEAEQETISNLVTKYYSDAVEQKSLAVVDSPVIHQEGIQKDKSFTFTADVEVEPEIDPKDYENIALAKRQVVIADTDVEARTDQIRNMYATLEALDNADRGIQDGDFALIDFVGTIEGKERPELTQKGYLFNVGSQMFFEGFGEQLLGMKKGESKTVTVSVPQKFHDSEAQGKEAVFHVTLKDIRIKKVPDLDDSFIKNFEKYETVDDFRMDVRKLLQVEEDQKVKAELENAIIQEIIAKNDFEVPSVLVDRQASLLLMNAQRRMMSEGMSQDEAGKLIPQLKERFKSQAMLMVKSSLLLDAIARKESITVDDDDVEKRIEEMAKYYGKSYETLSDSEERENFRTRVRAELMERKALEFIEQRANVTISAATEMEESS
ncbi:MAG: trigger factor [Deltaproteobacteria bacterium]|nr:trigger factor [Deltaproteobacteria bacterium]